MYVYVVFDEDCKEVISVTHSLSVAEEIAWNYIKSFPGIPLYPEDRLADLEMKILKMEVQGEQK